MCVVSAIGDVYTETFPYRWPQFDVVTKPPDMIDWPIFQEGVNAREIKKLRDELEELKKVIKAAQLSDAKTTQPNCDKPDKLKLIRLLCEALGVDLSELNLNV